MTWLVCTGTASNNLTLFKQAARLFIPNSYTGGELSITSVTYIDGLCRRHSLSDGSYLIGYTRHPFG